MKQNRKTLIKWAIGGTAAFFGANLAGILALTYFSNKRMNENHDANNMMISSALSSKKVDIKPDTDYAYINCIAGSVEITLQELPLHYDLYIELGAICSSIVIKLPSDINISLEGEGKYEALNNLYSPNTEECLPTVHIVRKPSVLSSLVIKEIKP